MAINIFFDWLEEGSIPVYDRVPAHGTWNEDGWYVHPANFDFLNVDPVGYASSRPVVPLFEFQPFHRRKFLRWLKNRLNETRGDGVFTLVFRTVSREFSFANIGLMFIPGPGEFHFSGSLDEVLPVAWKAAFPPHGEDFTRIHPAITAMMLSRVAKRAAMQRKMAADRILRTQARLLVEEGITQEALVSMSPDMRRACESAALRKAKLECLRRAEILLTSHLSTVQRDQYLATKSFQTIGSDGKTYTISSFGSHNIRCDGYEFCIVSKIEIPVPDQMLAQKLLLETNAPEFLRIANRAEITNEYVIWLENRRRWRSLFESDFEDL